MSRWNIAGIAFYSTDGRRRVVNFFPNTVNIITGASGTGKSAIIDAIDYCLGSKNCGLPFYVREHALAVAVQWVMGDFCLISGRNIPRAGKGTEQMFIRTGRAISLPESYDRLEGITNRETARRIIEQSFGINSLDRPEDSFSGQKGRATIRDVTPYIFLSGEVIISRTTLLHDMHRPEKVRDIKATLPFFLGAVDQESVLAERRLRQLEMLLERLEREERTRERSQGRLTERSMALLSQAATLGITPRPSTETPDFVLLQELQRVGNSDTSIVELPLDDEIATMERGRLATVSSLKDLRERRRLLKQAIHEASGYSEVVSNQSHKLSLINHLNLDTLACPVCGSENQSGAEVANQIRHSLSIVNEEVAAVRQTRPGLEDQLQQLEEDIIFNSSRLREIEAQISALIAKTEDIGRLTSLSQERALLAGRIQQFLEMTAQDSFPPSTNTNSIRQEVSELRDRVDPEAKRDRLRDAENLVSIYATEALSKLPSEVPATSSRVLFFATPKITIVEPARRAILAFGEIGSDQNYLALHLALSFSLQRHFEAINAPVPGLIVIDQISHPYYAEGGDEKSLDEMSRDSDRSAMRQIVRFIFEETSYRDGLQVILIEHAYIGDDPDYVRAIRGRWTAKTGEKLIPSDWPSRR